MKYDISKFEELVEQGYLRRSEKGDLILYNYTDHCTYSRNWSDLTRMARGLILNKDTGEVVSQNMRKFFNLLEHEETFLKNLPDLPYTVSEKYDGSLLHLFHHNGEWQVATRGSFYSDQAIKGAELIKRYDLSHIHPNCTLITEIIFPQNKIIVDYGKEEKLVLLTSFNRVTGEEFEPDVTKVMARLTGIPLAQSYNYTIEEMIALQATLPKDQEGFVVRFSNGLRVKIKGDEYMRIAKILAHLSPISLWEVMEKGVVNRRYLAELPEEFRKDFEPIVHKLEKQYGQVSRELEADIAALPTRETTPEARKTVGLFLKETNAVKHKSAMFPYLLGMTETVDKYVLKQIRPNGNELK